MDSSRVIPLSQDDKHATIQGFTERRLNQLMKALDLPVELAEQVWEVYVSGMQDGNLRIGELL